jgi:hypothetical protein
MCSPRSSRAAALGLVLAALAPATAVAGQDLRSPDTRDAAEGRSAANAPSVMVVRMPSSTHAGAGTDWGDVVLGASGALIVLALSAGGVIAVQRRRHVGSTRSPATA